MTILKLPGALGPWNEEVLAAIGRETNYLSDEERAELLARMRKNLEEYPEQIGPLPRPPAALLDRLDEATVAALREYIQRVGLAVANELRPTIAGQLIRLEVQLLLRLRQEHGA